MDADARLKSAMAAAGDSKNPLVHRSARSRACGQSSVEVLVLFAAGLVILAVLVAFTADQISALQKQRDIKTGELALENIARAVEEVYAQGPGATRQIQLVWPEGVNASDTYVGNHAIVVQVYDSQIARETIPFLAGSLPSHSGNQFFRVKAFEGYVLLGDARLTGDPSRVHVTLLRNEDASVRVTLTNSSDEDASLVMAMDFNHVDMNGIVFPSGGTILGNATFPFDVNFSSGATAVGTYTGMLSITATFPGNTETLRLPLSTSVLVGQGSPLVAFPASVEMSTFGADTNSVAIQLCNVGDSDIQSLTFTPSSGDPGDWLEGLPTLPVLSAQSCTNFDLVAHVPDAGLGTYYGSLFLSDFTGSHTLTIPVALSVLGMSAFFDWDWTTGGKTVNAITGYTLTNRGGKPITFTHVKLQDWWQCDLSHSYWEQMEVDGGVIFSGSLQDGNTADTSDVTLPVLTSYSDNTLVFNDNIQDDNETFRAVVTFSDGSEYTSASFGPGCTGDVTPPATVTDLIVVPGAEPGTVAITFTYPGDDNYTGNAVYATLKKSEAVIDSEVDWNGATTLTWPGPLPLPAGGTAGSFVVADQMAGLSRYWSIRFEDENGNMSGLSNSPKQRPWNEYRFTGGDFNFSYFASSYPGSSTPVGISDVNKMRLHQIQLGDAVTFARIAFRIVEDVNTGNVWAAAVDMNATDINRVRFWYPAPANYLSTSANYDTAKSLPISGGVDLIDSIEFPSNRRYNGIRVGMGVPNDLYLDVVLGIIDFNMSHNMTEGTDPYDTGGSDV